MSAYPLDIRLARLEGAYEQISDRLNGFDTRFATIEQKIDASRESHDSKIDAFRESLESKIERLDTKIDGVREGLDSKIDASRESSVQEMNRRFERVDAQFDEMRKLIVRGGFAIGAFVLMSILLPLVQHFH